MKTIIFIAVLTLISCSDAPDQEKKKPDVNHNKKINKVNKDHLLKGYQDNLQKAKEMEKEVLRAAERKKKAIDDATK